MSKNKFQVEFSIPIWTTNPGIARQLALQEEIAAWCKEQTGQGAGFPYWQFAGGLEYPYNNCDEGYVTLYNQIYIHDDATRTAFKLKYGK